MIPSYTGNRVRTKLRCNALHLRVGIGQLLGAGRWGLERGNRRMGKLLGKLGDLHGFSIIFHDFPCFFHNNSPTSNNYWISMDWSRISNLAICCVLTYPWVNEEVGNYWFNRTSGRFPNHRWHGWMEDDGWVIRSQRLKYDEKLKGIALILLVYSRHNGQLRSSKRSNNQFCRDAKAL